MGVAVSAEAYKATPDLMRLYGMTLMDSMRFSELGKNTKSCPERCRLTSKRKGLRDLHVSRNWGSVNFGCCCNESPSIWGQIWGLTPICMFELLSASRSL